MYHQNLFDHVKVFCKTGFGGCKSQIIAIWYGFAGHEDSVGYPGRQSMRLGDDFDML